LAFLKFDEQKEVVAVERILRVVFIDPQRASPEELENLQKRLAEAEAAEAARKKPKEEKIPKGTLVVEGLVIDEWVSAFVFSLFPWQPTVFRCLPVVHITVYVELHMTFSVLHSSQVQPL
jgi:hypothetical protein